VSRPAPGLSAGERIAFLARAGEILNASLEYETTLERVAQLAVERLADYCTIELLAEDGELQNVAVAHADPQQTASVRGLRQAFPIDETSAISRVVRTGKPELYPELTDELLVAKARDAEHLAVLRNLGLTSALVVPLRARERTFGALSLVSADSGRRFGEDDVEFALQLARRAASAIDNARLYREAERSGQATEQAHALLDAMIEHSPLAKAFLDRDLRYMRVNAAMADLNGITADEHLGHTVEEVLPSLAPELVPLMRRALAGEVVAHVELSGVRATSASGDARWLVSYYPVPARGGEVIGIGELVVDITERRQLGDQNARLAAIVESSGEAIIGETLEGLIETWNDAATRLYGYTAAEAIGQHASMLAPPENKGEADELLARVAHGERIESFETVQVAKDGRVLDVALTLSPIQADGATMIGASTFSRDITRRKRAERALRMSEARKNAVIESSLDAIVTIDATGRVLEFNPAAEQLFGHVRRDVIGRELAELLVPERLREQHRKGLARFRETGEAAILGQRLEMPALHADGTEFPIELTVTIVDVDQTSGPTVFSASIRDLTERREADVLTARLAAIVQSSADAIIGKTLDGVIETWNDAAARLYGYTAEEAIGKHISMLAPPDRKHEIDELLEHVRHGDGVENFETIRVTKDGRELEISLTLSPICRADGELVGAATIARDVTEQRRAEREQHELELNLLETQKLESLGVLAGGIAHDFNNLLVGILGNTSLALSQLPPQSPMRDTLERVELAAQRTAELTRQMLAYAGKGRYVVQAVDLVGVVKEMTDLIQATISKKARLSFAFDQETPVVEADVTQLRQVVLNLITNASDALGDRSGTISVATGSIEADRSYLSFYELSEDLPEGRYAFLEIADTGEGMDEETKAKIFEPFFTTKFTGRGLGLAAALGIVRGHRGAIKVYSEPGRGTSFKLLFPASTRPEAVKPPAQTEPEGWRGRGTVLVTDDESSVREVVETMLGELGFDIVLAENGREALRVFTERQDELVLVILDLMMPGLDGDEVLAELERLGPGVPIILSSGYNAQEVSQRFVGRGVAAFLQKPYRFPELAAAVRDVLEETTS
jgi:PAS domain S-box-containing protein